MPKALVIGLGSIGSRHANVLEKLGCEVAVVSRRTGLHRRCYSDIADAIDAFSPSYVVVATETTRHPYALRELDAARFEGIALVEKPLFATLQDAYRPRNYDAVVGYNLRFHPLVAALKRIVNEEGAISAEIHAGQYLPDWRPGRDYRLTSSARADQGGGVLADLSHELDYANWSFGGWENVAALGGRLGSLEIDTDDVCAMLGQFSNCPVATIVLNYLDRATRREILLNTSKDTYHFDLVANTQTRQSDAVVSRCEIGISDTYRLEHEAALQDDRSKLCSYDEGLAVVAIVDAVRRSARDALWVHR